MQRSRSGNGHDGQEIIPSLGVIPCFLGIRHRNVGRNIRAILEGSYRSGNVVYNIAVYPYVREEAESKNAKFLQGEGTSEAVIA